MRDEMGIGGGRLNDMYKMTCNDMIKRIAVAMIAVVALTACGKKGDATGDGVATASDYDNVVYQPRYAQGFSIKCTGDSSIAVMVNNPWQGADSISMLYRVAKPAERIVAMSSTFVAMLEELDALDKVVGVSGLGFISSEALHGMGEKVADVGYDTNVDYEKIVMLNPDLVLLYGINGPNMIEGKLDELGIPYIYIGDYVEESPLGKAEWVVAIGQLIGKRDEAISAFDGIARRYNELKGRFSASSDKPKVMINTPYNDSWWMPSSTNYMPRLIADAGGDYIYKANTGNASKAIDIEQAYMLVSEADIWINPGQAFTKADVAAMAPRMTDTKVFTAGKVYNNNRRSTKGGGNDFYESGAMHPDIILKDLAKIFYPDSLEGYQPEYYHQLQ